MKKQKILISLIIFAFILMIATISNAADIFTTTDGIVVTKVVEGYKGDIDLKISNMQLSSEGNYVWGISDTSVVTDVKKWFPLGDFSVSNKTATINLVTSQKEILALLRKTNTIYLFIKNTKDETFVINNLELDLTLPPYHAFDLYRRDSVLGNLMAYYVIGGNLTSVDAWDGATYNIKNAYYKFDKVTDSELIKKYNNAVENNTSMEDIFSITTEDIESITDWKNCTNDLEYAYTKIDKDELPSDNELYILYIKAKDSDSKIIYGYKIWPFDGKKVKSNTGNKEENPSSEIDKKDNSEGTGVKKEETPTQTTGKIDTTTATYKTLPNTGLSVALIGSIILIIIGGIAVLAKYHKYRDVK